MDATILLFAGLFCAVTAALAMMFAAPMLALCGLISGMALLAMSIFIDVTEN